MSLQQFWGEQTGPPEYQGHRAVILQLSSDDDTAEVAGVVIVDMPSTETGPFRAWVKKLMVHPRYRRMGIARRLLGEVEVIARAHGRVLLMLDTAVGTEAEITCVYERLGYVMFGVIPQYGISPRDGSLVDEKFYYKSLR